MSQEPEKKETEKTASPNPADRFNKVNRKTTIIWTGIAVVAVLALALILFFASKGGFGDGGAAEGSGSLEGTVVINEQGQKVLVDEDGKELEVLEDDPVEVLREIGNSNLAGVKTDTGSGVSGGNGTSAQEKQPWGTLSDEDYKITVRTLAAGYDGAFLEDGSDEIVKNVLALQFVNNSDKDLQYAEYVFSVGGKPISFKVSDLPAGQSCVVLESGRHQYDKTEVLDLVSRVVAPVDLLHADGENKVLIIKNAEDNTLTLMNTTDAELPVVRVYYKYYYQEENTFVGGITYTATAEKIPAGGSVTIAPDHYEDAACVITGFGVYDN